MTYSASRLSVLVLLILNGFVANLFAAPVIEKQPVSKLVFLDHTTYLNVEATSEETIDYQWYHGESEIVGAVSNQLDIVNAVLGDSGEYWVKVTSGEESVDSERADVAIADLNEILDNDELVFITEVSGYGGTSFDDLDFSDMLVEGDMFVNGSALRIGENSYSFPGGEYSGKSSISAIVQGPALLTFRGGLGFLNITVTNMETDVFEYLSPSLLDQGQSEKLLGLGKSENSMEERRIVIVLNEDAEYLVNIESAVVCYQFSCNGETVLDDFALEYAPIITSFRGKGSPYYIGDQIVLEVKSQSLGEVTYELYHGETKLGVSSDGSFELGPIVDGFEGDYRVRVFDEFGETWSDVYTLTFLKSFQRALGAGPLRAFDSVDWPTEGWTIQTEGSHDGIDAVVSDPLEDGERFTFLMGFSDEYLIFRFWWKVVGGGSLAIYIGPDLLKSYNGEGEWEFGEVLMKKVSDIYPQKIFRLKFKGPGVVYLDEFSETDLLKSEFWLYDRYGLASSVGNEASLFFDDDDSDGYSNIFEWILETNPDQSDSLLMRTSVVEMEGLSFLEIVTGAIGHSHNGNWMLVLQGSNNMAEWSDIVTSRDLSPSHGSIEYDFIDDVPIEDTGSRFLRLVPRNRIYAPGP